MTSRVKTENMDEIILYEKSISPVGSKEKIE
jgi:hypothetical protein